MINNKIKKPIVVQPDKAALLSSAPIKYMPTNHVLLREDVTSAVIFTQLEFLYRRAANKIPAESTHKASFTLSYSQLGNRFFPWMSLRNLKLSIKWLASQGILSIDRSKKKKNSYSINEWNTEYVELMSQQIPSDPDVFILVFPQLANLKVGNVKLGLIRAMVLQRIHYMSREQGLISISQTNIRKYMFNCVSLKTIQRSVRTLLSLNILVGDHDEDEKATIYAIDYQNLQNLIDSNSATETLGEFDDVDEIMAA